MKKKTIGLLLAALLVLTSLWLPASLGGIKESEAVGNYVYNPDLAAAWAANPDNVNNTDGKCATFVARALAAGGLQDATASGNSVTGTLVNYIKNNGYGSEYTVSDSTVSKIKPGDVIAIYNSSGIAHVMMVTQVDSSAIWISQRNTNRCNYKITFSNLKKYHTYWDGGTKTTFISMNDTADVPPHTHDKGTYMFYEAAHPHRNAYKCSICGTVWADDASSNYLTSCDLCLPGKPAFIGLSDTNWTNVSITFQWNPTDNTTHYNFWLYKQDTAGEYIAYEHTFYVESGFQRLLDAGAYKAVLQSYDSNHWFSDGSDWAYIESDPVYFVVAEAVVVNYNANGGTCNTSSKTVTYGQAYGTLPTPTRIGYTFDGWYTAKTGGSKVTSTTVCNATANHTLYAHWRAPITVTLNPNGGSCGTASKQVTYGKAYGTMPVPTRKGYTFAGWWTAKTGGKKVTASTVCYASGNYTLYARWTEGYTMTFNPTGGTVSPTTKVVKYGQQYGTLPTPTRAGYTFAGWWTAKTGGKQVTASTVCYASAGYTLYARWTAKKFVITLNPNGGECATATKTVTYGQAYGTMPVPSPRTGYTFAGWYTAKTGGKKVTATTVCYATGNYTLYARWTPKTYTVTFNPNGGSCTVGSKTVTYGQTYGTLPVPTRSGSYIFGGWWTTPASGGKQVFSSTTCYATGSYTLYARWWKN